VQPHYCEKDTLKLHYVANYATDYVWRHGAASTLLSSGVQDTLYQRALGISDAGKYIVWATNSCGTISDTVIVAMDTLPRANPLLNGKDLVSLCEGVDTLRLAATILYSDFAQAKWLRKDNSGNYVDVPAGGKYSRSGDTLLRYVAGHKTEMADSGYYYLVSYNRGLNGCKNDTTEVYVSVNKDLTIRDHLLGYAGHKKCDTVCEGDTVSYLFTGNMDELIWYIPKAGGGTDTLRSSLMTGLDTLRKLSNVTHARYNGKLIIVEAMNGCKTIRDTVQLTVAELAKVDTSKSTKDTMI
jgi:hypothetical protein